MNHYEKKYYAFFDVDGTILKGKPMLDFLKFYYQKKYDYFPLLGKIKYSLFKTKSILLSLITSSREVQNKMYYLCFKGQKKLDVAIAGREWFSKSVSDDSYLDEIIQQLNKHKLENREIVLVSGSFSACLDGLAKMLAVDSILATELEEENGFYTGNIVSYPVIGHGKHKAILDFISNKGDVDLNKCFAYGDHISDFHMLALVGNPFVIGGDKNLEKIAINNNWKIIRPN